MRDLISIIVPVYNAEAFLERCVSSARNQTWNNLEILLVDDGSTDGSAALCDTYAEQDARIRVIHRENGGLSAARNTGIEAAQGDYLMFLDADDEMLPEMAETLMVLLRETDADIAECEYSEIENGEQKNAAPGKITQQVYDGEDVLELLWKNEVHTIVQWNKLYRRRIFDTLRYPEGKYHEDEWVVHRELAIAKRLAHTNRQLYRYYRHPATITAQQTMEKGLHVCEALSDRIAFLQECGKETLAAHIYAIFTWYCGHFKYRSGELPDSDRYLPAILALEEEEKQKNREYERALPLVNRIGRFVGEIRLKWRHRQ